MQVLVDTTATSATPAHPVRSGRLAAVTPTYHRLLADLVDKVVEYRVSPDVLTAVCLGAARGAGTVAALGWWPLAIAGITVIGTVAHVRRNGRSRELRCARGTHVSTSARAALRRHPRRPPARPRQPTTSRRPHRCRPRYRIAATPRGTAHRMLQA